jgi:hypothetical protein
VELLKEAKAKYNAYDSHTWTKAYFDKFSGGYNVYHKDHCFQKKVEAGTLKKLLVKCLQNTMANKLNFCRKTAIGKVQI